VACDHYHRWRDDIELMKALGVDAYRFSIAWPRVIPGGDGPVNPAGLAFYDRLVDALLEAGITPYPTLYHWDLPQALQDRGGWAARETAERFAAYSAVVAAALGDRVTNWVTLNEPRCSAWIGHLEGRHAPGIKDIRAALPASYHLLLGHGLAAQAIRANSAGAHVGLVNLLSACEPASDREADVEAAARFDGHANRWWLDPVYGRGFPEDMLRLYNTDLPVRPGDMETIAAPLDWLGVNYYTPSILADDPDGPLPHAREVRAPRGARRTLLQWEIRAEGLEQVLVRVTRDYAPERIYVTVNGSTPSALFILRSISPSAVAPLSAVCPWPDTSPGHCLTTSSGRTATSPGSGSSTSTTKPSGAWSRTAVPATRRSSDPVTTAPR